MHLATNLLKLYSCLLGDVREIGKDDGDDDDDGGGAAEEMAVDTGGGDGEELSDEAYSKMLAEQNEKIAEQQNQALFCYFVFCHIWSVGGTLDGPSRVKFDEFFRELIEGRVSEFPKPSLLIVQKNYLIPKKGSIYDYFFDRKQMSPIWSPWSNIVESVTLDDKTKVCLVNLYQKLTLPPTIFSSLV